MNQPSNSFPFVPLPFPFFQHSSSHLTNSAQLNDVPARVRMALETIEHFTVKTMKRVAVNDISIEEIEGGKLSTQEEMAREAAAMCLTSYFSGKYAPDLYEDIVLRGRELLINQPKQNSHAGPGTYINCVACYPKINQSCTLCRGTGGLMVYPTVGEVEEKT